MVSAKDMGPTMHLISAAAASALSYLVTRDLTFSAVCGVSCVLPDMDHLIEYLVYKKGKWVGKEFWSGSYFAEKGTIYVVFHSFELALLMGILCIGNLFWKQPFFDFTWAITIGYYIHLVLDIIGNDCVRFGYSTIFRWKQHWKLDMVCDSETGSGHKS